MKFNTAFGRTILNEIRFAHLQTVSSCTLFRVSVVTLKPHIYECHTSKQHRRSLKLRWAADNTEQQNEKQSCSCATPAV